MKHSNRCEIGTGGVDSVRFGFFVDFVIGVEGGEGCSIESSLRNSLSTW